MKKLLFFICIITLAISFSYGYEIVPITAWTTQEAILPATPDNLATQMAGGVIVGIIYISLVEIIILMVIQPEYGVFQLTPGQGL